LRLGMSCVLDALCLECLVSWHALRLGHALCLGGSPVPVAPNAPRQARATQHRLSPAIQCTLWPVACTRMLGERAPSWWVPGPCSPTPIPPCRHAGVQEAGAPRLRRDEAEAGAGPSGSRVGAPAWTLLLGLLMPHRAHLTPAVSRRALHDTRLPQRYHWRGRLQCDVRSPPGHGLPRLPGELPPRWRRVVVVCLGLSGLVCHVLALLSWSWGLGVVVLACLGCSLFALVSWGCYLGFLSWPACACMGFVGA
jgi:hypothetical protein